MLDKYIKRINYYLLEFGPTHLFFFSFILCSAVIVARIYNLLIVIARIIELIAMMNR